MGEYWGMKFLLLLGALSGLAQAGSVKLIYGRDNRVEPGEAQHFWSGRSLSVAAMVDKKKFLNFENSRGQKIQAPRSLGQAYGMCQGVRFAEQPVVSECSGFLVGDDLLVTAGHCVLNVVRFWQSPEKVCESFSWVFDMEAKNFDQSAAMTSGQAYNCKEVLQAFHGPEGDFAIIQLDRPVKGIAPLRLAQEEVERGQHLGLIGHPSGLPKKISLGARVLRSDAKAGPHTFIASTDSFHGDSGAPVFNSGGEVVGILVSGKTDYVFDAEAKCRRENVCDENGENCEENSRSEVLGEGVNKISTVLAFLQAY